MTGDSLIDEFDTTQNDSLYQAFKEPNNESSIDRNIQMSQPKLNSSLLSSTQHRQPDHERDVNKYIEKIRASFK